VKDDVRPGRSSSPVRHSPPIKLVEDESGRELLARLPFQIVPRIGEAVLLLGAGEDVEGYRVVDVRWGFDRREHSDEPPLNAIEIRVRHEGFDKG
jgi:hypothetical protein